MEARLGKQEKARGLERGGSDDNHFCADGIVLHGLVVDEVHAAGFAGLGVDSDFTHDCVGAQGQISGVHRRVDQAGGRVKGGMNVATALAFAGAASVTAAAVFVVLEAVSGDAGAILRKNAAHFCEAVFQGDFGTVQLGGTLEDTVGEVGQIFFYAGNAEI